MWLFTRCRPLCEQLCIFFSSLIYLFYCIFTLLATCCFEEDQMRPWWSMQLKNSLIVLFLFCTVQAETKDGKRYCESSKVLFMSGNQTEIRQEGWFNYKKWVILEAVFVVICSCWFICKNTQNLDEESLWWLNAKEMSMYELLNIWNGLTQN